MKKLVLEVNKKDVKEDGLFFGDNARLMITPQIDEKYWTFRIKLYRKQALLAFPKFGTYGIGFAQEINWNTNLPYTSNAEEIYNHIKVNKKHKEIRKSHCIKAIEMLQEACKKIRKKV